MLTFLQGIATEGIRLNSWPARSDRGKEQKQCIVNSP